MTARDPQRILRTIRRTTAGSLLVAAVGSGVVAVHLAGDRAGAAAATAADAAPSRTTQGAVPSSGDLSADDGTATPTSRPRPTTAKRKHHKATSSPSQQGFTPVAPVKPGNGPAQSGSSGS